MVSKKFKLLLALTGLLQTASLFAQDSTMSMGTTSTTSADWAYDSSKASNKENYSKFANYETPYPSRPKGMWELSLTGGNAIIIGDRPFLKGKDANYGSYTGGVAGGISARFALSHVFSVRLGYLGSQQKIPGYKSYIPFSANQTHMLNADVIASLNTISSFRGNPKVNYYVFAGYSIASTRMTAGVEGSGKFDGAPLYDLVARERNDLIDTYGGDSKESQALYHNIDFGFGLAFRLSPRVNIGFEERISNPLTGIDFLDGFNTPRVSKGSDKFAFSMLKLAFNLGNTATHTEPLWWVNPNNYVFNELATPKHMKIPIPVLPDGDGDGIIDQFDMEPNTPAGCAVDSHGVTKDTDGDGVPDCKDKEVLTPQSCFPVNADGVGACPEPECCKAIDSMRAASVCNIGSLPSVQFKSGSSTLSSTAKSLLNTVAQQLQANPTCKVKVVGYGASSKRSQQLSWAQVNAVKTYLSEQQGISESRIIFTYGMQGSGNTVDLIPTTEEGPNTVPAPHPNL